MIFQNLFSWHDSPSGPNNHHCSVFESTLRQTTIGRTPLNDGHARRTDLYLTTHNTHYKETTMPLARFEPAILASLQSQNHVLDRLATGIGNISKNILLLMKHNKSIFGY